MSAGYTRYMLRWPGPQLRDTSTAALTSPSGFPRRCNGERLILWTIFGRPSEPRAYRILPLVLSWPVHSRAFCTLSPSHLALLQVCMAAIAEPFKFPRKILKAIHNDSDFSRKYRDHQIGLTSAVVLRRSPKVLLDALWILCGRNSFSTSLVIVMTHSTSGIGPRAKKDSRCTSKDMQNIPRGIASSTLSGSF